MSYKDYWDVYFAWEKLEKSALEKVQVPREKPPEARPFWIVWAEPANRPVATGTGSVIQHESYDAALKEAERLAADTKASYRVLKVEPISKSSPIAVQTKRY